MRLAVLLVAVASSMSFALEPVDLTADEFKLYRHYKLALEDPRVQAMKPEARLVAIAKDAGFKLKDLQRAIEKGEGAGDVKAKCEANLKEVLEKELPGRLGKLEVDTAAEHVVAYVQWLNEEPRSLAAEACIAAARAAAGCPISSTISVYAQDRANPKARVFQALISTSAAKRIDCEKVRDFAETRYLKLFEKVKTKANGDDLSRESGVPTAKP